MSTFFENSEYQRRLAQAAELAGEQGIAALVISPGPDLRYLTGYHAHDSERLTALIVQANGDLALVAPELERGTATASPIGQLPVEIVTWQETDDPYARVASLIGAAPASASVAVDDRMWAVKAIELRKALPRHEQVAAGCVLTGMRMRKSAAEVEQLRMAGAAIDRVHHEVPNLLRVGRTENEVAREIADLILREHSTADFVIVASGPNGASPHHLASDRVIESGDVVVVDIGGTTGSGYCSDSTRTYAMGEPTEPFASDYARLQEAQELACQGALVGVTCEQVDALARDFLTEHGLGEYFIHRTGHGIGLETHEAPYMVTGNQLPLEAGMAFSVEPGFYRAGQAGARIEDIVIATNDGPIRCNNQPHELVCIS